LPDISPRAERLLKVRALHFGHPSSRSLHE
jgi:hypothetical protein